MIDLYASYILFDKYWSLCFHLFPILISQGKFNLNILSAIDVSSLDHSCLDCNHPEVTKGL